MCSWESLIWCSIKVLLCAEYQSVYQQNSQQTMVWKSVTSCLAKFSRTSQKEGETAHRCRVHTKCAPTCCVVEVFRTFPGFQSGQLQAHAACGSARLHGPLGRKGSKREEPIAALRFETHGMFPGQKTRNSDRGTMHQSTRSYDRPDWTKLEGGNEEKMGGFETCGVHVDVC